MKRLTPREQALLWKVGRAIHGNLRQPSFRYIALDYDGAIRLGKQYDGQTEPEILPDAQLAALFDSYTDDVRRLLDIIRRRTSLDDLPAQHAGLALKLEAIVNDTAAEGPFRYVTTQTQRGVVLAKRYDGQVEPVPVPLSLFAELVDSYSSDIRGLLDIITRVVS